MHTNEQKGEGYWVGEGLKRKPSYCLFFPCFDHLHACGLDDKDFREFFYTDQFICI